MCVPACVRAAGGRQTFLDSSDLTRGGTATAEVAETMTVATMAASTDSPRVSIPVHGKSVVTALSRATLYTRGYFVCR